MNKFYLVSLISLALGFTACSDDDDSSVVDVVEEAIEEVEVPDVETPEVESTCVVCTLAEQGVEICEGENGNAFLGGIDTMISYAAAIASQELSGSTCK